MFDKYTTNGTARRLPENNLAQGCSEWIDVPKSPMQIVLALWVLLNVDKRDCVGNGIAAYLIETKPSAVVLSR
jgi:hypothetical protein